MRPESKFTVLELFEFNDGRYLNPDSRRDNDRVFSGADVEQGLN